MVKIEKLNYLLHRVISIVDFHLEFNVSIFTG
jgi:hypothetical protein